MATTTGTALARRLIDHPNGRIVALDSATFVEAFYDAQRGQGDIIVNASYSGVFCARLVAAHRPRAAIGLDCAIGKDGAGIAGLHYYEALDIAAAAVDVETAEMGNGLDMYEHGIISRVNGLAELAGVTPGMSVEQAATLIGAPRPPMPAVPTNRVVVATTEQGRSIVCTDSIAFALPEDHGRNVLCVGGHTGASIIGYLQSFRPFGFLCSDGGIGKNRSGLSALAVADGDGLPGAAVSAASARMGDGRSTYFDGVVSAVNELGERKGVRVGQTAKEAAMLLLHD